MQRTSLSSGLVSAGIGLTLGLALVLPAGAADEAPTRAEALTAVESQPVVRPIERPIERSAIDVIPIACEADGNTVGCSWRATTAEAAVGYQLWRIVDRGEREYVWRGGLDQTSARDAVPEGAVVVRYAVLAVDVDGNVVGQSRPVMLRIDESERPVADREAIRTKTSRINTYGANTYR